MKDLRVAFKEANEHFNSAIAALQQIAMQFIMDEVQKQGGEICFTKSKDWFSITYDGGNHPEYYATPFSTVKSVFIKNDSLYVELEDCEQYPIENVSTWDLAEIANHL